MEDQAAAVDIAPLPILCFDLDGTLLDSDDHIHPQDAELLSRADLPALLIPTTGRSLGSVRQTFAENGLFTGQKLPLPLVLLNGSLLYLPGEVEAAYHPFPPDVQEALLDIPAAFPDIVFFFFTRAAIYELNPNAFGRWSAQRYKYTVQDFDASARSQAFSKMLGLSPERDALSAFARHAARLPVEGAYSLPTIYELNAPGISKAGGVQQILAHLGRAGEPFYAAGDGENDRQLLEAAALAFVPHSASQAIRQMASQLIDVPRTGLLEPMLAALPG
jgi:HAD superfamily hydrolase (TIGR01484 family)